MDRYLEFSCKNSPSTSPTFLLKQMLQKPKSFMTIMGCIYSGVFYNFLSCWIFLGCLYF